MSGAVNLNHRPPTGGGDQATWSLASLSVRVLCWAAMLVLFRAVIYSTLFISLVLIFVPAAVLARAGVSPPPAIGMWQFGGIALGAAGAALAVACIFTFVSAGRGTPAPFDPPRRLVVTGPYRFVRNPMYIGAAIALTGAAMFYRSWALMGYLAGLAIVTHLLVAFYEEPTLRRMFGDEYGDYCERTGRWWIRS